MTLTNHFVHLHSGPETKLGRAAKGVPTVADGDRHSAQNQAEGAAGETAERTGEGYRSNWAKPYHLRRIRPGECPRRIHMSCWRLNAPI